MTDPRLHQLAANTIRALAIDATNAADSGHPGAPMGMADLAVVLWTEFLRFDPSDPKWPNRDRFVLSNGHASMLLYSLLHLGGFDLSIEELKRFRQLGSKTPGHPEYGLAPGVETTTGPLGQGFANGVGMAMAARIAHARFGERIDHKVFGFCGDGCLMEGLTSEAASIAGHLKLHELCYVYDDNKISIDGSTQITFTEDVELRFRAYGWRTMKIDGHDPAQIREALEAGRAERERPTLIIARTHIGWGSPNKQDTSDVHGSPLGAEEAKATKEKLGWSYGPFEVPEEVRALFRTAADRGRAAHQKWSSDLVEWKKQHPDLGAAWDQHFDGSPSNELYLEVLKATGNEKTATRNASGKALNAIAAKITGFVGGSADLAVSTKSMIKGSKYLGERDDGRSIAFGVREHAMGAIVNGMALWGGFIPYGGTFLTFSDYMRASIRLAAVMKIRSLFLFTHDSIYLGEDGPTHQAVEHAWALRLIPGLEFWRPADGMETAMAWTYAATQGPSRPHALSFTRQNVPPIAQRAGFDPREVWRGGYVVSDPGDAQLGIIATGSEVHVAVEAAHLLSQDNLRVRVVSMPCLERFEAQDAAYRESVLPRALPLVSIEVGRTPPWKAITGREGLNIGIDTFGESAPFDQLQEHFGMSPKQVAARIRTWWSNR
jgi:transketolase